MEFCFTPQSEAPSKTVASPLSLAPCSGPSRTLRAACGGLAEDRPCHPVRGARSRRREMVLTVSPGNASRRHRSSGGQNSNERPHDVLPKPAKLICSRHGERSPTCCVRCAWSGSTTPNGASLRIRMLGGWPASTDHNGPPAVRDVCRTVTSGSVACYGSTRSCRFRGAAHVASDAAVSPTPAPRSGERRRGERPIGSAPARKTTVGVSLHCCRSSWR